MTDKFSVNGDEHFIKSWNGGRLNAKAHGPGTLAATDGDSYQCSLNQGVISGYCWLTHADGDKYAEVYNTKGELHGTQIGFLINGHIRLHIYNNGVLASRVKGMTSTQYMYFYKILEEMCRNVFSLNGTRFSSFSFQA